MSAPGKRPICLPDRRVSFCERVAIDSGHTLFLHCGFDLDGVVREIFVDCRRATSELASMLRDMAMGISYRLQYGPRLEDITPTSETMRILVARAIKIERECAGAVIAHYQAADAIAKRRAGGPVPA